MMLPVLRLFIILLVLSTHIASAATLVVTSNADAGPGTLRQAVIDALSGDVIEIDASLTNEAVFLDAPINIIDKDLVIDGLNTGFALFKNSNGQPMFLAHSMAPTNLTIRNLNLYNNQGGVSVIEGGAAINIPQSNVALTLEGMTISEFASQCLSGTECKGGVVFTEGASLTVTDSLFFNSRAFCFGGNCSRVFGGAIYAKVPGDVTIQQSKFVGTAVGCDLASACTIANGGTLALFDSPNIAIENNLFVNSQIECDFPGCSSNGSVIYQASKVPANMDIVHNAIQESGGSCNGPCPYLATSSGNMTLQANIMSTTDEPMCGLGTFLVSQGHNVYNEASCFTSPQTGDFLVASPELFEWQLFGGGPQVSVEVSLPTPSTARDLVPAPCAVGVDINGLSRPFNGACEAGPLEERNLYWTNTVVGDYFDTNNWSGNVLPDIETNAFINNGGTAIVAMKDARGGLPNIEAYSLVVGDHANGASLIVDGGVNTIMTSDNELGDILIAATNGTDIPDGTYDSGLSQFHINDINTLFVGDDVYIGSVDSEAATDTTVAADIRLWNIDQVIIQDDLEVADQRLAFDGPGGISSSQSNVSLSVKDVTELTVGDDIDFVDGYTQLDNGSYFNIDHEVNFEFVNVDTLSANSIDLAEIGVKQNGVENLRYRGLFQNIKDLSLFPPLDDYDPNNSYDEYHLSTGYENEFEDPETGIMQPVFATHDGEVIFDGVTANLFAIYMGREMDIADAADFDIDHTIFLRNGTRFVVGGDSNSQSSGVKQIRITDDTDTPGKYHQVIHLDGSALTSTRFDSGINYDSSVPNIDALGQLVLSNGSFADIQNLNLYNKGEVVFHIDGTIRTDANTLGGVNQYSAMDVSNATMGGRVVARFNQPLSAGSHTFDLMVASDDIDVSEGNVILDTENLDPGFNVDSFGKVVGASDTYLRLELSGAPTAADLVITQSADDLHPAIGGAVQLQISITNSGPTNITNALVNNDFSINFSSISWSCAASNGAICFANSGNTDINNLAVDVPVGGEITITVNMLMTGNEIDVLNEATVTSSSIDYDLNNNSSQLIFREDLIFENGFNQ